MANATKENVVWSALERWYLLQIGKRQTTLNYVLNKICTCQCDIFPQISVLKLRFFPKQSLTLDTPKALYPLPGRQAKRRSWHFNEPLTHMRWYNFIYKPTTLPPILGSDSATGSEPRWNLINQKSVSNHRARGWLMEWGSISARARTVRKARYHPPKWCFRGWLVGANRAAETGCTCSGVCVCCLCAHIYALHPHYVNSVGINWKGSYFENFEPRRETCFFVHFVKRETERL